MKKGLILFGVAFLVIGLPLLVSAQGGSSDTPYGEAPLVNIDLWEILFKALNWFFNIVLIIAIIFLVYGGFLYITAGGDSDKTKKALNTVIYSLIGVAIALLAKALINFVSKFIIGQQIITH